MTTNFNYKILIYISLIGIILLFITGIPESIFSKLSVSEEYNKTYSLYETMHQNLDMKSSFEETKEDLLMKIKELNIDTDILQDKIINILSSISMKNNIVLNNIKFSDVMPVFSDDFNSEETLEAKDSLVNSAICMKVTVDFDSDFSDMLSFVDDVKNCETEVSVLDISILLLDNDKVRVMMNLMFYALPMEPYEVRL